MLGLIIAVALVGVFVSVTLIGASLASYRGNRQADWRNSAFGGIVVLACLIFVLLLLTFPLRAHANTVPLPPTLEAA